MIILWKKSNDNNNIIILKFRLIKYSKVFDDVNPGIKTYLKYFQTNPECNGFIKQ